MSEPLTQDQIEEKRAVRQLVWTIFREIFISIILLAINAGMVFGLVQALGSIFPRLDVSDELTPSALPQLIIYLVPVMLLFLEWHAWDILTSTWRKRQ
ncbi:MAG: hypothetical protein RL240_2060 [Planctomycetota bacterium]|jgi:hypothetical protein